MKILTQGQGLLSPQVIQAKIDNLNKPKGSLGRLETLAMQICLVQQTLSPKLTHPCHILFGGDHGIEREGVSASPRDVTWQQMLNYGRGGGGVNMFCRQHGFKLRVVDVGVDYDFDAQTAPHIINRKIAYGTKNFLYEAAMSQEEWERALAVGAEQVDACKDEGCNIICIGEMGIANTSPSSIIMHLLTGIPLQQCVGAGSGLNDAGVKHKFDVLQKALSSKVTTSLPTREGQGGVSTSIFPYFMGFEMAAATGAMLRAAEHRMLILVDGFIMSACMLAASRMEPSVLDFAIFGHCGDEGGHKLMLEAMGAEPLLNLGLRLGEGTGALCAYPIVQSAVNMINEMDNFDHAQITKYF
ncbi:MAG: nicotinate-nucleotide--dimethylbenzimidazole phosphoribosyltransferase [Bacteroidaceae bacterium]|nr:nicotinate-nucleotide--dimethylbenzimidazole phosphoribosyltransferase [Bacteroidaceae bacterium]